MKQLTVLAVLVELLLAPATLAAPTFVSAGTEGFPAFSIDPGIPAGDANNDILLLIYYSPDNVAHGVSDGGYTKKLDLTNSTTDRLTVWWKRRSGTQTAPSCTGSVNDGAICTISAWRGLIASGDPFDVTSTLQVTSTGAGTTYTVTGITTVANNAMVLIVTTCSRPDCNFYSASGGTATTQAYSYGNGNGVANNDEVLYGVKATAGTTGTTTIETDSNITDIISTTFSLKPVVTFKPNLPLLWASLRAPLYWPFRVPLSTVIFSSAARANPMEETWLP